VNDHPCVGLASTVTRLRIASRAAMGELERIATTAGLDPEVRARLLGIRDLLDKPATYDADRQRYRPPKAGIELTETQWAVMSRYAAGRNRAALAAELGMTVRQVNSVTITMQRRLGTTRARPADLVAELIRRGSQLEGPDLPPGWVPSPAQRRILDTLIDVEDTHTAAVGDRLALTPGTVKDTVSDLYAATGITELPALIAAWAGARRRIAEASA
jgi:hypothetical protein